MQKYPFRVEDEGGSAEVAIVVEAGEGEMVGGAGGLGGPSERGFVGAAGAE